MLKRNDGYDEQFFIRRMTMNARKISLLIVVSLAGLLMLNGCKKSEPAPTETSTGTMTMQDHVAMAEETAGEVVAAVEQKTCPVMGGAINEAIFVEYKGKKVYFCCDPCKEKFEEAPEQYVAKLPQFNQ
jgi:YHS domain-containing protein